MGFLRHQQSEKFIDLNHKKIGRETSPPPITFLIGKAIP